MSNGDVNTGNNDQNVEIWNLLQLSARRHRACAAAAVKYNTWRMSLLYLFLTISCQSVFKMELNDPEGAAQPRGKQDGIFLNL